MLIENDSREQSGAIDNPRNNTPSNSAAQTDNRLPLVLVDIAGSVGNPARFAKIIFSWLARTEFLLAVNFLFQSFLCILYGYANLYVYVGYVYIYGY